MRLRQCKEDGCYAIVTSEACYCPRHKYVGEEMKARKEASDRQGWDRLHKAHPERSAIWKTTRWRKMRTAHLKMNPFCVVCGSQGTSVDHIVAHKGDEGLAYDAGNLQTLCHRCHFRKTRSERAQTHTPTAKNGTI